MVPIFSIALMLTQWTPDPELVLKLLLKEYRTWGLPEPAEKTRLVKYREPGGIVENGKFTPNPPELVFLYSPGTKTEKPSIFPKPSREGSDPVIQDVKPDISVLKESLKIQPDSALVLAIQCFARDGKGLSEQLLKKCPYPPSRSFGPPDETELSLQQRIQSIAYSYWYDKLSHPTADRTQSLKYLQKLHKLEQYSDDFNRTLLESLELSLAPSKAKPGSVEALIDGLIDHYEESHDKIVKMGFDAVPTLIKYLDDDRLTRTMMPGFNNFRPWHLRVGDAVAGILENLACEEFPRYPTENRVPGGPRMVLGGNSIRAVQAWKISEKDVNAWWKKAGLKKEEEYLMGKILPAESSEYSSINDQILEIIAEKYPKRLPELYRKMLSESSVMYAGSLPDLIRDSKVIELKDKQELFQLAMKSKVINHRIAGLLFFRDTDRKSYDLYLKKWVQEYITLERPSQLDTDHYISALIHYLRESNDKDLWDSAKKIIQEQPAKSRVDLLNGYLYRFQDNRRNTLVLVTSFMNDEEIVIHRYDSAYIGSEEVHASLYPRIAVRDYVALELGSKFGITVPFDINRRDEDWAKIREKVREAVKKESAGGK